MAKPNQNAWKLIRKIQKSGIPDSGAKMRDYSRLPEVDAPGIETPAPSKSKAGKRDGIKRNPILWGSLFWPVITLVLLFSVTNLWLDYDSQSKAAFLTISGMTLLAGILQFIQTRAFIGRS